MIGVIVCGHGYFAQGISSSIELIMGKQSDYEVVDFPQGDSITHLDNHLKNALHLLAHCEDIMICCDLFHGSPFNQAMMLSLENEHIKVMYGVNVGMLMEMIVARQNGMCIDELCDQMVSVGKEQIGRFKKEDLNDKELEDDWE